MPNDEKDEVGGLPGLGTAVDVLENLNEFQKGVGCRRFEARLAPLKTVTSDTIRDPWSGNENHLIGKFPDYDNAAAAAPLRFALGEFNANRGDESDQAEYYYYGEFVAPKTGTYAIRPVFDVLGAGAVSVDTGGASTTPTAWLRVEGKYYVTTRPANNPQADETTRLSKTVGLRELKLANNEAYIAAVLMIRDTDDEVAAFEIAAPAGHLVRVRFTVRFAVRAEGHAASSSIDFRTGSQRFHIAAWRVCHA